MALGDRAETGGNAGRKIFLKRRKTIARDERRGTGCEKPLRKNSERQRLRVRVPTGMCHRSARATEKPRGRAFSGKRQSSFPFQFIPVHGRDVSGPMLLRQSPNSRKDDCNGGNTSFLPQSQGNSSHGFTGVSTGPPLRRGLPVGTETQGHFGFQFCLGKSSWKRVDFTMVPGTLVSKGFHFWFPKNLETHGNLNAFQFPKKFPWKPLR